MKPSLELAEEHFRTKVLPRRIIEKVEIVTSSSGKIKHRKRYRKASRDEVGELYPLCEVNFRSMAQFGLGVSVYLLQLVMISIISFLAGTIMVPAIHQYASNFKGSVNDVRLLGSATCESPIPVNATCADDEICLAARRENCPLYQTSIICDIVMSLLLLAIFYLNMFVEKVDDRLDEVIQTSQDYSVVVRDPPPKTHKPDDYFEFFKRFGRVKYVTVTKKNKYLGKLLLRKHLILRHIDTRLHERVRDLTEYKNQCPHSWWVLLAQRVGLFTDDEYWMNQLVIVNKELNEEYKKVYDTCRVYVSYETEAEQRLCLEKLRSSMLRSMSNESVMRVLESAEPNNILWQNLENSFTERSLRFIGAWLLSFSTMIASFLLIQKTYITYPTLVPIVIGLIDLVLPTIFLYITIFECHVDEDNKQNSLMFKLYGTKLLSSVFFTYANTKWDAFLDEGQLTNILNIQLSASFVSPLIKSMDLYGVTMRWIVSPLVSNTQAEMNRYWEGTSFTLADRYTEISKILFISLFYSFLVPIGLFVSTLACLVLFAVDRYLLFRKTKPPPMLDATMASSVPFSDLLFPHGFRIPSVAELSHLCGPPPHSSIIHSKFSWPFDSASWSDSQNSFIKVDKEADYMIWRLKPQPWHSEVQHNYLNIYKWFALAIIALMLYVFFLEPLKDFLLAFFFPVTKIETARLSSKPYSSIAGIVAYCPVINYGTEKFIFADTRKMLTRHKPETITIIPNEECNIGEMVPKDKREDLLAVVQWYTDGTECDNLEEQVVDEDVITSVIKSALPTGSEPTPKSYFSMTPTTPDIIRIDIETPDASSAHKPQTALELIAHREMEGSRIRRARQKMKSASVTPVMNSQPPIGAETRKDIAEKNEPVVFTREEVHLLRQLRKEFLAITIKDLVRVDILPPNSSIKISFEEYLTVLQKFAPDGLTRACPNSSAKTIQEIMKLHRPMLRRIYLKFLSTQNYYSAKLDHKITPNNVQRSHHDGGRENQGDDADAGKMDLIIFLEFIQNGFIVNLHKEQIQQQQQLFK